MSESIPPSGSPKDSQSAQPQPPSSPTPMDTGGGASWKSETMGGLMRLFTPDQRKKFNNLLIQNLTNEIKRASAKYVEELRRQREELNQGG